MQNLLAENLDYANLFAGIAFFFLGTASLVFFIREREKGNPAFAWIWLVLFAFIQGFHQWLQVLTRELSRPGLLSLERDIFLAVSFLGLFGFVRRAVTDFIGGRVKVRVILFWLVIFAAGFLVFPSHANRDVWIRYTLGFPAAIGASLIFWNPETRRRLAWSPALPRILSILFLVYAFFGILIGPRGVLGLSGFVNEDYFFRVFLFPAPFFSGLIISFLAFLLVHHAMGAVAGWRRRGPLLPGLFLSFVVFYIISLASGIRFVNIAGEYEKNHLKHLVLSDIRLLADALEDVGADIFDQPQSAIYPLLRKAHQRMAGLADIGPYAKSLYFVTFNLGRPEFLVGSQAQVYPYRLIPSYARNVPEEIIRDAFYAKHEAIVGPYTDAAGVQVFSVFVPLHGKEGMGIGLLGVDLDNAKVYSQIARVRLYAIFVVMAFLILLVGGYAFLIIFALKNLELQIQKTNLDKAIRSLKEAEAELAKSEETFRGILNNSPNAIFGFDQDLRLIFWNHGAQRLYRYAKEDVVDEKNPLRSQRFVTLLGIEESSPDIQSIFDGATWIREMTHRIKGGASVPVFMTAFPVKDPQGHILFGMGLVQDISAYKLAEERQALANAQLRSVLDGSTHLAIVVSDLRGLVTVVNKGVGNILGFPSEEIIGKPLLQFFPIMDNAEVSLGTAGISKDGFDSIVAFLRQGRHLERQWTLWRKDGTMVHLEVTISGQFDPAGTLEGVIVIGIDRSARQEAERALGESEQRYKELVNNLRVGVYLNTPEPGGHFIELNPAMVDIFEADSIEQLMQFPISRLYRYPEVRREFSEKLLRQGFLKNEEIELVTLKGRYFMASVSASVRKKDDGTQVFYGILQDVTDQKRLELSLREERDRLRKIASHIGAGLALMDSNMAVLWANEVMEQWFGRLETMQGKQCFDVFHRRAALCDECPTSLAISTGSMQSMEKRVVFPNGKVMDFAVISSPIKNERGEVVQVLELVLDFTDRHRMYELLEYERALSRNVIDSIGDPLVVFDAAQKIILDVNRVFLEATGLKKKDVIGKSCDAVHLSHGEVCRADELDQVLRTGKRKEVTSTHRDADGHDVYLDVSLSPLKDERGLVVGLIHIMRDVSDRKRLEDELKKYSESLEVLVKERTRALQASELMFRRLFESAQDGILIIDLESGIIIDANSTLLELLGIGRDALKDKDFRRAPCFSEAPRFQQALEELKHKTATFVEDVSLKTMAGKEISVELSASLYQVENRNVVQCYIRDITERKKLDKIKTEFVSMVSHELRTPLSAIKEGVEIVADGTQGKLNRDQAECLNIALSNIRRLNRLIGDILDISKIQSNLLKMEIVPCGIADLVDQVYSFVRIEMEKRGLVLVTDLQKDLPEVMADKDRLMQVLMNLLNNAVKFTRDNSKITLKCRRVKEGVEFSVADQGPGIPADEISRLFGRFVQLDSTLVRRVGGTGLGLYISKNLLEAMGGTIWAESSVGEGTIFKFILPVNLGGS